MLTQGEEEMKSNEFRGKNQWNPTKKDLDDRMWRERYMARRRSRGAYAVNNAISTGILPEPKYCKCVDCGETAQCYDHRDYRKPMMVDPVCFKCDSKRGSGFPYISPTTKKWREIIKVFKKQFRNKVSKH